MNSTTNTKEISPKKKDNNVSTQGKVIPYPRISAFAAMFLALFFVCLAVSSFQSVAARYYDDVTSLVTLGNWGPPIFAIALGLGWFTVHMLGEVPQWKRPILAIVIYIVWSVESLLILFAPYFIGRDGPIKSLAFMAFLLIMAGGFLRHSAFVSRVQA